MAPAKHQTECKESEMTAPTPKRYDRVQTIADAIEHLPNGATLAFEEVSWDEYEELLETLADDCHSRITYDSGRLEIMSPSGRHDYHKSVLGSLVEVITDEMKLSCVPFGSATFRKKEIQKGTEPDECFFITTARKMLDRRRGEVKADHRPDLAIEVDIYHQSKSKFAVYAALGVPEIWRYRNDKMSFYRLADDDYVEIEASDLFPFLTPEVLAGYLNDDYVQDVNQVRRAFRKWVRKNKPK